MAIIKTNHQREPEAENLMLIKMNLIKQQSYKITINQTTSKKVQTKGKKQQLKI
jgi:hypothetical protein